MRDKDITAINVDDYIREKKRAGAKYIRWGKNGAKAFKQFATASYPTEFGYKLPRSFFGGMLYMGIKHYK